VRRNFYRRLLAHSEMSLNRLPLLIAKNILKYYGDITIEGLLDCANHLMAGNELKSAQENCGAGTIEDFFKFGVPTVSVKMC